MHERIESWAFKMVSILDWLGYPWPRASDNERDKDRAVRLALHQLDTRWVLGELEGRFRAAWGTHDTVPQEPRQYQVKGGVTLCRYVVWMGSPEYCEPGTGGPCTYQRVYMPIQHVQLVLRFRVCNWPLGVYRNTHLPREARKCLCCRAEGVPEDEFHVVFECPCYADLRVDSKLDFGVADMRRWWCVSDAKVVGWFLHAVYVRRAQLLKSRP
jgi:hypothetical protein